MTNYVLSYWLNPDAPDSERQRLLEYFEMQRYTKAMFGAKQLIVSNVAADGVIKFDEPPGFHPKHALLVKWLGLGQLLADGLHGNTVMHDHDTFVRRPIVVNDGVRAAWLYDHYISEQICAFPTQELGKVMHYNRLLRSFIASDSVYELRRTDSGCIERHRGAISSESVQMYLKPFSACPRGLPIHTRDLVSFDIGSTHSLDTDTTVKHANPIEPYVEAVHCHLGRGEPTRLLNEWLHPSIPGDMVAP